MFHQPEHQLGTKTAAKSWRTQKKRSARCSCKPIWRSSSGVLRRYFLTLPQWYLGLGHSALNAGLGYGPEKTRFPKCLVLPYIGTFFLFFVIPGWFVYSRIRPLTTKITLLYFRPGNEKFVMIRSTLCMRQNR